MAWLRQLGAMAASMLAGNPPNKVIEMSTSSYSGRVVHCRDDESALLLYLPSNDPESKFELVLQSDSTTKLWSLQRCDSLDAAELWFTRIANKVSILVSLSKDNSLAFIQRLCDTISEHPSWNVAHLAVKLQLFDCLTDQSIKAAFHQSDPFDGMSPLQLAIETDNLKIVKQMLALGAPVDHYDHNLNSVLHYAACSNRRILALVTERSNNAINCRNSQGQTPLHLACVKDKRDCVIALLEAGADVNISIENDRGSGEPGLVENVQQYTGKFSNEDIKHGGTPIHWACSQEVIEALVAKKCDINVLNFHRRTALHMMILRERFDCVVCLLSYGADTTVRDMNGDTPLRLAVKKLQVLTVKALIVFNADIHELNGEEQTLRHGIACGQPQADEVLYVLHAVGVKRCNSNVRGCSPACSATESYNGLPPIPKLPTSESRDMLNLLLEETTTKRNNTSRGRLLCLDGGGIRGLVLIVILMELEKTVGVPILSRFDWVAGTSTGGILALAMAWGKSLVECLQIYFKLKNTVFVGSRPYQCEPLEEILKDTFGEETTMTDIKQPRIMVAATLADRQPVVLHWFRNYASWSDVLEVPHTSAWVEPKPAPLQKLWEAARASGAAPSYFKAAGCYLDGGLISNNPTLDAMAEMHKVNCCLNAVGRPQECAPLSLVVSLGTGCMPTQENDAALVVLQASNLFDFRNLSMLNMSSVRGIGQCLNLIVDQATQADGEVVDRARSLCSFAGVAYYRLCPMLSKEVALNETQNDKLVNMMWETRAYMHSKLPDLQELFEILRQPVLQPT